MHSALQFVPVNSMAKREIVVIEEAFTREELAVMVEKLGQLELQDALVGSTGQRDPEVREARVAWLDHDEASAWLYLKLMQHVQSANTFFGVQVWGIAECLQYSEYGVGGRYRWHRDNGIDPCERPRPPRKVSFSLQLSHPEEYEGGELEILAAENELQTKAFGALILFPSYVTHQVRPVLSGMRKSLVGWACGNDFV